MTQKLSQASSRILLSNGTPPLTNLTRTIHPVGQGAFYSEIFGTRKKKFFTVVYDCGYDKIVIPGISHYAFVIDLIYNYLHTGKKRCDSISFMLDCLPELRVAKNNSNTQNQIIIAQNSNWGTRFKVVQEGAASIEVPNDGSEDSLLWRYDAYSHKYDKEKEKELILNGSKKQVCRKHLQ